MRTFLSSLLLCLVLCLIQGPLRAQEGADTDFGAILAIPALAEGHAHAREASWEPALGAYERALPNLSRQEDIDWCRLLITEMRAKAKPMPRDWEARRAWERQQDDEYLALLKPYEDPQRSRGAHWLAVMEARIQFLVTDNRHYLQDHRPLRGEIIETLAARPPSAKSATQWLEALRQHAEALCPSLSPAYNLDQSPQKEATELLSRHLKAAANCELLAPEARAWASLRHQVLLATVVQKRPAFDSEAWQKSLELSRSTPLEPLAKALRFIDWAGRQPTSRTTLAAPTDKNEPPQTTPAAPDFQSLLQELRSLRDTLPKEAGGALKDYALKQLETLERNWSTPVLNIVLSAEPKPGQALGLDYGQLGYKDLSWELHRLPPSIWAQLNQSHPMTRQAFDSAIDKAKPVAAGTEALPPPETLAWKQGTIPLAASMTPGLYAVAVSATGPKGPIFQARYFSCTELGAHLLYTSTADASLWLEHPKTGKPLARGKVDVLLQIQRDSKVSKRELQGLRTDENGRVALPAKELAALLSKGYGQLSVVATVGDSPAVLQAWPPSQSDDREKAMADLFVERRLYRPGETVRWRFFVRERKGDSWRIPARSYRMIVVHREEESVLLDLRGQALDEAGAITGSHTLPATLKPGALHVALLPDNDKPLDLHKLDEDEVLHSPLCTVDNFVPPPVSGSLSVVGGAGALKAGAKVTLRAQASYFSGGPVPGAKARLQLRCHSSSYVPRPGPPSGAALWASKLASQPAREITTDAEGRADFPIEIPDDLEGYFRLQAELTLSPEGMPPLHKQQLWNLSPAGVECVALNEDERLCAPGGTIEYRALLLDGAGAPAPAVPVVATLCEKRWLEVWLTPDGTLHQQRPEGLPLPEVDEDGRRLWNGWELLKAEYFETKVSEHQLQAGPDGKLRLSLGLPREGAYSLHLSTDGHRILPAENLRRHYFDGIPQENSGEVAEFLSATANTRSLALKPGERRLVAAPADAGKPGLRRVLVATGESQGTGFLACLGARSSTQLRLPPKQALHFIEVTLVEGPHAAHRLQLALAEGGTGLELPALPDPGSLELTLTTPGDTVTPGSEVLLSATTHTAGGKGAPALLALAVTDDALDSLMTDSDGGAPAFEVPRPLLSLTRVGSEDPSYGSLSREDFLSDQRMRPADDDDLVILSPFEVSTGEAPGYAASATLAGSRIRTNLKDIGSAISVVTPQFLEQIAATHAEGLLTYTTSTELGGQAQPRVRRHFSSSAFWAPLVKTDASGKTEQRFKLPDNLTRWKARAYAVNPATQRFATSSLTFEATLPLQARLKRPRFLVAGDTLALGGTIVNRDTAAASARISLGLSGPLRMLDKEAAGETLLPPAGERNLDWALRAEAPGAALLRLDAATARHADASEESLPVLEDGSQLPLAATGVLASGEAQTRFSLALPEPLDRERTQLRLELSPSLAGTLLEALPYLLDYPYGCVEQTMSRFLPAAVVATVLTEQGLDPAKVEQAILARTRIRRTQEANMAALPEIIEAGLKRLREAQREDGGFGWWPGSPRADLWMSTYVKWGLATARAHKLQLPERLEEELESMESSLDTALLAQLTESAITDPDLRAWTLAALATDDALTDKQAARLQAPFELLYLLRPGLSARGRACLALAGSRLGSAEQRATLLRNLMNGCVRSSHPGLGELAQWGLGAGYWRCDDSAVEATAFTLLALLRLEPSHPLVAPAAHWLALNRRGSQWSNTRETAFAVLALTRFLQQRGEGRPDARVALSLNGQSLGELTFGADALLAGTVSIPVIPGMLQPGDNTIELRRVAGRTPVFASALASAWSRSDTTKAAGHLVSLQRRLLVKTSKPGLLGPVTGAPEPVAASASVGTGARMYAELALHIPQDCSYLMVRVPKAAGCEPFNPLSAWDARLLPLAAVPAVQASPERSQSAADEAPGEERGRRLYREEYDDCSLVFIDSLEAGDWSLRLPLTAVHAGDFRLLPATLEAMYVSEIRANTTADRLRITD